MSTADTVVITGYNGASKTVHPRTAGGGVTRVLTLQDWGEAPHNPETRPTSYGWGVQEIAPAVLSAARNVTLRVLCHCGTEAVAFQEIADWRAMLAPHKSTAVNASVLATVTFNETTSVTRYMNLRPLATSWASWEGGPGAVFIGNPAAGVIEITLKFETWGLPLFRSSEQNATVSLSASNQNVVVTNDGVWPTGVRIEFSSLVGNWTAWTATPAGTGFNAKPLSGGAVAMAPVGSRFANGDYLDWRHTTPWQVEWPTTVKITNPGTANIVLPPGNQTVGNIGVGGTSGTLTYKWYEWFS